MKEMIEAFASQGVQIQIKKDGSVIWVNIDGICIARITCASKSIELEDNRKLKDTLT